MGCGIAQLAANAGATVTVFDVNASALAGGRSRIDAELGKQASRAKITTDEADAISSRIRWTETLGEIGAQDLVIEAVLEDLSVKRALFAELEAVIGDEAILVTNTSSIPIARLSRDIKVASRFAGMHFFNPATIMRLVEVVPAPDTAEATIAAIENIARGWGKLPVRVADVPGFIVNRVARPFYAEGFRALQEGIDPAVIDLLFRDAVGYRMGPLELADLIGHDINFAVARSVFDSYFGNTRFVPQLAQAALVDSGRLGRKTGRGVFRYESAPIEIPKSLRDASGPPKMMPASPGYVIIDEPHLQIVMTRGATAAEETKRANRQVAVVDCYAAAASVVGFAAADGIADETAQRLARMGVAPYRLPDRPGLVVARTLAQIANAAADAVLERVSDEPGIDAALRFGANYPSGPFAWADQIGRAALASMLHEIALATGQPIYAPSEYWNR